MNTETVAVIDLGTNTFHLLLAELNERDDFVIKEKFKEPVKLGEGGITAGKIANKAFTRGIRALKKFRTLLNSRGATKVYAFATSAIRSASNGKEFVQAAREQAGINIRIINGNEEAALIFEGVRSGVQIPYDKYSLLIDIGGGSVEFIVTYENRAQLLRSLNIGAARLLETISPEDPISKKQVTATQDLIRSQVGGLLEELKEFDIGLIVGSSGTFETLGSLIAHEKGDIRSASNLNSYRFNRTEFDQLYRRMITMTQAERMTMQGMEPMRVDMIVMGSIFLKFFLTELKAKEVMISSYALKEGILFRSIEEKKQRMFHLLGSAERNVRAKNVMSFGKQFKFDENHAVKVSELAIQIFDQVKNRYNFGSREREMLKYSCLLHDIGHFLNRSGHHKHGQYMIMNSNLPGFSSDELVVIGNIVRYHRKSPPTRDHLHFKILRTEDRSMVSLLAGILRIADNLDRGHRGLVQYVRLNETETHFEITVYAEQMIDIEIAAAMENRELLEQVLGKEIIIRQENPSKIALPGQ
ncbi:MAG: Ppx/GppA family phosphatase [Bacteroidia bacterium]|nr:Ppx/GppA family phosphatase [Bacteroidia bacterium]